VQDALAPDEGLMQRVHTKDGAARLHHCRPHVTCMDSMTDLGWQGPSTETVKMK
jgi:hypothetical protein